MKWASTYTVVLRPLPFMPGMGDTILSAYTQLNLSNGIHVGTIFYIGMEGYLHHLQESGVTAKGNDPTPQAGKERISVPESASWPVTPEQ